MSRNQRTAGGHNFMEYADVPLMTSQIIPQEIYPAPQPYEELPSIQFYVQGLLGIKLVDALNPTFNELENAKHVPRMSGAARKITLRLKWPGYDSWSDVLHVFDHTYNVNPNNMKKVAQIIAQKIRAFWNDMHDKQYNEASGVDGWQLNHYPFERLVLLELRHVSQGSWQPVLAVL